MTLIRSFMLAPLLLAGGVVCFAQSEQTGKSPAPTDPTVTVSISAKGVRFAALGSIGQMRLEVFNTNGDSLYNSEFQAGNLRDWALDDRLRQRLPDGSYLCVVAVRDVSGRLSIKQGTLLVQGGRGALKLGDSGQVGALEPEKELSPVSDGNVTAVTLTAHNGRDGQVVSTRGSLTFRAGDFFAGKDKELMRLTPDGDLGVGVTAPWAKLDVAGLIRTAQGIIFPDGTIQTTAANVSATSPEPILAPRLISKAEKQNEWPSKAGKGDDLVSPQSGTLVINGDALENTGDVAGPVRMRLQNRFGVNGALFEQGGANDLIDQVYKSLTQQRNFRFEARAPYCYISSPEFQYGDPVNPTLVIADNGALLRRGNLLVSGNVGIGTTNPQAKLDVAGDLQVSGNAVITGNIAAKYQDVAEWVPASQRLAPGTVVSLDLTRTNAVVPSARPYDTHIAGIVSSQPGVILGQGGEGKVLVATTGRVKVQVDATRHPIRIGDLLVTSDKSGVAMKSQPFRVAGTLIHRPGTIIGKALEPLAKGKGEILVLLSLQ